MNEPRFTPGPWVVVEPEDDVIQIKIGDVDKQGGSPTIYGSKVICFVNDIECDTANAHLIAAAPDLYQVLAEIVQKWGRPNTADWHKASAALAKARGEV